MSTSTRIPTKFPAEKCLASVSAPLQAPPAVHDVVQLHGAPQPPHLHVPTLVEDALKTGTAEAMAVTEADLTEEDYARYYRDAERAFREN